MIQLFSIFAISPGLNSVQSENRKRMRMRSGADDINVIAQGSSLQSIEGIALTFGGANTLLTLASGLCSIKPAHTAKSRISLRRMRIRLRVACFPSFSIGITAWMTIGAVISSSCRDPKGSMMYLSSRRFSSL